MNNSLKTYTNAQRAGRTASPATQRTPGRNDEVVNNTGGFVFAVSDKARLERFLILGTDGGTYYVKQSKHVKDNVNFLREFLNKNEREFVDTIVEISSAGRAYKNSPALFALALALTEGNDKAYVSAALPKVARTGTHLFEFVNYVDGLGGWGRAKRNAVANWYTEKNADSLAYQAVKYRQREGWTHRDVFRKVHPKGVAPTVGDFILSGKVDVDAPEIITGFKTAQAAKDANEVIKVLETYKNLPWEALPTSVLKDVKVWKTLFYNGQLKGQALFRNITRLAKAGAFTDMKFAADYAARMTDETMLAKTRMHPLQILNALIVYTEGQQVNDKNDYWLQHYGAARVNRVKTWTTESVIVSALNDAFYASFKYAEPAGKRTLLGVDVSGSMASFATTGSDLTSAQAAAAIAMTVARTEPYHMVRGFSNQFVDLGISAKDNLGDAFRKVQKSNFGSTDVSLPMEWALKNKVEVDTFVVITDNELNRGHRKPTQALAAYRKATGIDAKLAVLGTASNGFTVADPTDTGRQMDFVGFDSNVPRVLADFSAGRL